MVAVGLTVHRWMENLKMRVGQEGDDRKYRRLRKQDFYNAKAAVEAEVVGDVPCKVCGRMLGVARKNWGGYCFECFNEPK